ncbi:iron response transcriptional regulator IrrA [Paremcibacter congregatus]|uniref:Ferric uptake regulation protein n=1 Tax=Paremcibacter congregatus TaxID=2043170 RepID=A0A2G4YPS6_9PROT|nr:Fur family transcriptional regulator [Paremcibacter congregatus]PHZ84297.1 transcriptional repressor [Paremcibacter congregatus]QDE29083.1 transcriptional repressor [Paremcibacter congregatus]
MSENRKQRPFTQVVEKLREVGLRPTRQRLALAKLLFDGPSRHVTAEMLHEETEQVNVNVSLATVYNTLHQFTDAKLLREVVIDSGRTYFDTNTTEHHHFFMEKEGLLSDVPPGAITIDQLPQAPEGKKFSRVEVVIHVADADEAAS